VQLLKKLQKKEEAHLSVSSFAKNYQAATHTAHLQPNQLQAVRIRPITVMGAKGVLN